MLPVLVEVVLDGWQQAVLALDLLEVIIEALPVLVVLVVWIIKRFPGLLSDHLKLYVLDRGSVDEEVLRDKGGTLLILLLLLRLFPMFVLR